MIIIIKGKITFDSVIHYKLYEFPTDQPVPANGAKTPQKRGTDPG